MLEYMISGSRGDLEMPKGRKRRSGRLQLFPGKDGSRLVLDLVSDIDDGRESMPNLSYLSCHVKPYLDTRWGLPVTNNKCSS